VSAVVTAAGVTASRESGSMFPAPIVAGVSHMAAPVVGLVGLETIEGPFSTPRQRAVITVMRVKAVVNVTVESMGTVKPGSCADKDTAGKPVRAVIAIRSAIIWRIFEVPVGAYGLGANVDADADLGWRVGTVSAKETQQAEQNKGFEQTHLYLRKVRVC